MRRPFDKRPRSRPLSGPQFPHLQMRLNSHLISLGRRHSTGHSLGARELDLQLETSVLSHPILSTAHCPPQRQDGTHKIGHDAEGAPVT